MSHLQQKLGEALRERDTYELCLGYVRYEFVMSLTPSSYTRIWRECMRANKPFDDRIDELIEAEGKMNER